LFKKIAIYAVMSIVVTGVFGISLATAEEYQGEVMSVEGDAFVTNPTGGRASVKEGDVVSVGDTIETSAGAAVDIGFDGEWKNVSRVEESTNVTVETIHPTTIKLKKGGVFSILKELPKDSAFEVHTPTAIASVRGSEYRVTHNDGEGTQAFNFSDSPVYVYGMDEAGRMSGEPVTVSNTQKIEVPRRGMRLAAPKPMAQGEMQAVKRMEGVVREKAQRMRDSGRMGKIQKMERVRENGPNGPRGQRQGQRGPGQPQMQQGRQTQRQPGQPGQQGQRGQPGGDKQPRKKDAERRNDKPGPPQK
jgi:hypothetical protein